MKLAIVDDHEVVREGLRLVLAADPKLDAEVVGEASTGAGLRRLLERDVPDLVLLDYRLPDATGDQLCREVREQHPTVRVVVLSSYLSEDIVQRCLAAGAAGFVTKGAGLAELRRVLGGVAEGQTVGSTASAVVQRLHESAAVPSGAPVLTPRQERVLELVVAGWTYNEISAGLHISVSTVRFHVQRLKDLVGARSRTDLIGRAIRLALVAPASEGDS